MRYSIIYLLNLNIETKFKMKFKSRTNFPLSYFVHVARGPKKSSHAAAVLLNHASTVVGERAHDCPSHFWFVKTNKIKLQIHNKATENGNGEKR